MHYFVDGYNLLFSLFKDEKTLKSQRDELIQILNETAEAYNLRITLVFDAPSHLEGNIRTHFDHLEIIYTDYGETADSYILDAVAAASLPGAITVVTNDKSLARNIKKCGAQNETLTKFLRLTLKRKKKKIALKKEPTKRIIPPIKLKMAGSIDYYLEKFLERLKEEHLD